MNNFKVLDALICKYVLLLLICISLLSPLFLRNGIFQVINFDTAQFDFQAGVLMPPFIQSTIGIHYLGTGPLGEDVLAHYLIGTRNSLLIAIPITTIIVLLGIVVGCCLGLSSRNFLIRNLQKLTFDIITILDSIPKFLLLIGVLYALPKSFISFFLAVTATSWFSLSRQVRAKVVEVQVAPYYEVSKMLCVSKWRSVVFQLLPNILATSLAEAPLRFLQVIVLEATLTFLGFGLPPGTPSLGSLLNWVRSDITAWWILIPSVGTLVLLAFCINRILQTESNNLRS